MNDFKQVVWSGRNIQENKVLYQSDSPTIVSIAVPSIIQNNMQTITAEIFPNNLKTFL